MQYTRRLTAGFAPLALAGALSFPLHAQAQDGLVIYVSSVKPYTVSAIPPMSEAMRANLTYGVNRADKPQAAQPYKTSSPRTIKVRKPANPASPRQ
jgi:hypothetical protein